MKKIGLFYGRETKTATRIAERIRDAFPEGTVDIIPVDQATAEQLCGYRNIIAGASEWYDGVVETSWDRFMPELTTTELTSYKVAVFGLGDQHKSAGNFADNIGLLARAFREQGAEIVGFTEATGYTFKESLGLYDEQLEGLALDEKNQADLSDERIRRWGAQLQTEFL